MAISIDTRPYRGATPDPAVATREAMAAARSGSIPLVEAFYSLQGEGLRTGEPTVFLRTAGCNCDCWFCDTDFRVREVLSVQEVVLRARDVGGGCRWACLTGGEPTIHALGDLCSALHADGWRVQMETNGGRARPEWHLDHITVSPKERQGRPLDDWYLSNATEYKYIVADEHDSAYATKHATAHTRPAFVQPNSMDPASTRACIKLVLAHPERFRLSLQTHKLLEIP